jgi:hypothetical protein
VCKNKIMNSVPFSPSSPIPKHIRPCVKCMHYRTPNATCVLYGSVNVITGDITYSPVASIRQHYCKGRYYSNPEEDSEDDEFVDVEQITEITNRDMRPDSDSESQ